MSGPRVLPVGVLVAAALAASGCGAAKTSDAAGGFQGEAKGVATTLDDLQRLGRSQDEDAICVKLLATQLVDQIKRASATSCPTAVSDVLKDVDAFALKPDGKDAISVSGATATARVVSGTGKNKRKAQLQLVKQGGRWKLSTLGA